MNSKKKLTEIEFVKKYWKLNSKKINWFKTPEKILTKKKDGYQWFVDGKINIAYNCLENKQPDKPAVVIFQKNERIQLTYQELKNIVDNFSIILKNILPNKQKKISVLIHAKASIASVISMLACAKLGFQHCVLFDELPIKAIQDRVDVIKPEIIITGADKKNFNEKIKKIKISRRFTKVISITEEKFNSNYDSQILEKNLLLCKNICKNLKYSYKKSNENFFTLFTSGSTGKPKGIVHNLGGYLTYAKYTCVKGFGMTKNSISLTASDAGWINGHTYALYGPLSIGCTSIILDTPLKLLDEKIFESIIKNEKVTILYLPVTLIRMMRAIFKKKKIKKYKIETLGSMGEPLAKDIAKWFSNLFGGNMPIVNTYYQTETCGIICSPTYKQKDSGLYGTVGKPLNKFLGVKLLKNKRTQKKEIVITNPWPGCMKKIIGETSSWKSYWYKNSIFKLFDAAEYDNKKNLIIHGRLDDVMNIRGHRVGSAEIETSILKSKLIKEASAISVTDALEGENIVIFYSSRNNKHYENIITKIITKTYGTFATPKKIFKISELPKTRSGKILRRLLRDLYYNSEIESFDTSTMINPKIINEIKLKIMNNNG